MNDRTAEQVVSVLKALSHPVRLKIAEMLGSGEKCVNEIVEEVGGKQSITSWQLNMMKDKGVLSCRREGARVYYKTENPNITRLLRCVCNNNHRPI
jgi:ArsR family transcriptional regulator